MHSRRHFIHSSAALLATLAALPERAFSLPIASADRGSRREELSYAALAGQINTVFRVRVSLRQTVPLVLLRAPRHPTSPGPAGYEQFSLIFRGPQALPLAAAIHPFEHDSLGQFGMFISPVGQPQADDVRYEASFSRPVPPAGTRTQST